MTSDEPAAERSRPQPVGGQDPDRRRRAAHPARVPDRLSQAEARQPAEPVISYDPALPISAHVEQIGALLADHQVLVVAGETGSGKTTQIPKICLQLGRRRIGHTQPRRIAARTVAERLAEELQVPLGETVGYQVRFTRQSSRQTRVKVMTDGVMLAEINHDRLLRRYDTIIIDEAHERSLNIDFLLGYLKQLLPSRPDLKVIITSATIDTQRFAEHFADEQGRPAPIVEVSGRTFPVEVRYRPVAADTADHGEDQDMAAGIVAGLRELGPSGDVLVFLSGEREIREAARAIEGARFTGLEVLPLFARLSAAEQHRVFAPHATRRVVLATNVAETSLTVPGIRSVIDTGLARISRYSARTKVQRLPIEPISRASADQRAGRCGRVAPGVCIRLYSQDDYASRPEFTEPEILRTNLASVILKMAQAELGDIATFPFVEAPDRVQVGDGLRLLDELGALRPGDRRHPRLTDIGRQLAELPLDPRLGRMLIEAGRLGCLREVEVIVSALAIQDVRERPAEERQKADQLHRRFFSDEILSGQPAPNSIGTTGSPARYSVHEGRRGEFGAREQPGEGGDLWAIWRLWRYLGAQRKALSGNQFRRLCRAEYINFLRVREWQDLHTQIRRIDDELGVTRNREPASVEGALTGILAGLLSHVGLAEHDKAEAKQSHRGRRQRKGPQEYLGARGAHFAIQPGSALSSHPPELVMAVELVETSRLWARTCAQIQSEWIEQVGAHLLKHSYSEPHWSSSTAGVLAYEKVSLYGIPVIARRLVDYGRIDAAQAREIFIRTGLVEQSWVPDERRGEHAFLQRNRQVRQEIEELEERTRRRDLLVDDQTIFDFYDARIPSQVHSAATFDAWWAHTEDHSLLDLHHGDLVRDDADTVEATDFPDQWQVGNLTLPVSYVFEPGSGSDGVTVSVPLAELNQLCPQTFSWQVPGLRTELATELIRTLPKPVRIQLVPAPDRARQALRWLRAHDPDHGAWFHEELGRALAATTGVLVDSADWAPEQVPGHLRVSFRVSDRAKQAHVSKDLAGLQHQLTDHVSQTLTRQASATDRTGYTSWTFGPLARTQQFSDRGITAVGHPALRDDGDSVAVVVLDTAEHAERSHAAGVRRLLVLTTPDPTRWVVSHLGNQEKLWLGNSPYGSIGELLADARLKTVDRAARGFTEIAGIRDAAAFEALALQVRQVQADMMRQVVSVAASALENAQRVRSALEGAPAPAAEDVAAQLDNLVFPAFISFTRDPWYDHLPRYLAAAAQRLDAARANPAHDERVRAGLDELCAEYDELCQACPPGPLPDEVDDIGFLIEELRVQTFAQRLRTAVSVSPQRIRKAIRAAAEQLA
ncbi:ATP-dependent helicase HrpA [Propionibacterium cyclohexanicum]|uniref:ATP-dependent helicase HrpA n=1 Tax=Propionibacterium cyclohexanicum TaxID=64702 RepID=A0A1H9QQU4_9ACTN|nr:ATP-dependent RNA helicase HrpA [Propionibacterium cyclohexanicum]SER62605.1 ATP-dependent helicase HrpA [Propionibacterium cyclohexanicum]